MLTGEQERGKRMALSNVSLFGAAFLTPVVAGKITNSLNWQWTFYLAAIFTGAALPLTFFLVPETAFRRATYLNTDFEGDNGPGEINGTDSHLVPAERMPEEEPKESKPSFADGAPSDHPSKANPSSEAPAKSPYWKTLLPFNGRKTDENFFKLLLRPFPLFLHPGILWVSRSLRPMVVLSDSQ